MYAGDRGSGRWWWSTSRVWVCACGRMVRIRISWFLFDTIQHTGRYVLQYSGLTTLAKAARNASRLSSRNVNCTFDICILYMCCVMYIQYIYIKMYLLRCTICLFSIWHSLDRRMTVFFFVFFLVVAFPLRFVCPSVCVANVYICILLCPSMLYISSLCPYCCYFRIRLLKMFALIRIHTTYGQTYHVIYNT